mgnify:CR=1 FL=1
MDADSSLSELTERLKESSSSSLGDSDYLSRYETDSGDLDTDEIGIHGMNRLLFAVDAISGGDEQPIYAHFIAGIAEIVLSEVFDDTE